MQYFLQLRLNQVQLLLWTEILGHDDDFWPVMAGYRDKELMSKQSRPVIPQTRRIADNFLNESIANNQAVQSVYGIPCLDTGSDSCCRVHAMRGTKIILPLVVFTAERGASLPPNATALSSVMMYKASRKVFGTGEYTSSQIK